MSDEQLHGSLLQQAVQTAVHGSSTAANCSAGEVGVMRPFFIDPKACATSAGLLLCWTCSSMWISCRCWCKQPASSSCGTACQQIATLPVVSGTLVAVGLPAAWLPAGAAGHPGS